MSKAILILDMPDSCEKCEFCDKNVHLRKVCHAKAENSEEYGFYYREIENGVKKPDWCPLRPVPEKKKEKYMLCRKDCFGSTEAYGEQTDRIAVGYNKCIDDILGGSA